MTLTDLQMQELLENAPPKIVGTAWFDCPNCGTEIEAEIEETAWEVDEDGKLYYDCPTACAVCKCGAKLLVAEQPDGENELYWLNEKEMPQDYTEKR